jgi:hypothetical protein
MIPQLVAALALAAPVVTASSDNVTPTASLARSLVDPIIREPPLDGYRTAVRYRSRSNFATIHASPSIEWP